MNNKPIPLETVVCKLPTEIRVLVLAPHPDDFDAIGVTLRYLHKKGNPIFAAVLSGSASGVLDSFVGPDPEEKCRVREQEQRAGLKFFGLPMENLTFLRLPEDKGGDPVEDDSNETTIRRQIELIAPGIVLLPHGNDTNKGHQRVFAMFQRIAAAMNAPLQAFYIRDPKTTQIRTDVYTAFGEEEAQWKRTLLLHHASQEHRNRKLRSAGFDDRLLNVNHEIARDLNIEQPYAEAFEREVFSVESSW